jgi:ABC-type glycerol-3-phosphate transport system substrate-binding protein
MFSPEADLIWGKIGGQVPMRMSTFKDPYYDEPKNAYMEVVLNGLSESGWALPLDANMKGYLIDILKATHAVLQGEKDPRAALEEAEESFNRRQ